MIPGLERSLGVENGNLLQYSCLGNPTEEPGRLQSMELHSQTRLSEQQQQSYGQQAGGEAPQQEGTSVTPGAAPSAKTRSKP